MLNLNKYNLLTNRKQSLPIFTSRGCYNNCIFCVAGVFSKKVVFAPLDLVFENIDRVKSLGYNAIRIQDDTFGMKKEYAYQIIKYLKKKSMIYSIKSRVEVLDEDFMFALKETGCFGIKFGVESIVPHVLNAIQKRLDLVKLERVLEAGKKLNINLGAYILIGNPHETYDDAMETLRFCSELTKKGIKPIMAIGCYIFPGTQLEVIAKTEGLISKDFDWSSTYLEPRNKLIGYDETVPVYTSKHISYNELVSLRKQFKTLTQNKKTFVLKQIKKVLPNSLFLRIKKLKNRYIQKAY